jgi:hypothetical protein
MVTKAKVIKNRHGQLIRLPREFWVNGDFVYIERTPLGFHVTERDPWEILVEGCREIDSSNLRPRTQPKLEKRSW